MRFTTTAILAAFSALTAMGQGCNELFFSEYIEGSSFNKAIEIYNPTSTAISLDNYTLYRFSNGSLTGSTVSMATGATVPAGGVYVLANSQANSAILAVADETNSGISHNGNDGYALVSGTDTVDFIGPYGNSAYFAQDTTLVRLPSVSAGTTVWTMAEWSGDTTNASSNLGAHTSNCGGGSSSTAPAGVVAINTFNSVDANGVADSLGAFKWIKGIVTSIDFDGNAGYSFYVQDATAGINIYNYADVGTYTTPTMGDSLYIHGEVDQYNGLTELFPDSIIVINSGNTLPAPMVVTSLYEGIEGSLVKIENVTLVTPSQWPASGSANVDITDGTNTMTMRIDSDTDIDGSPAPTGTFSVVGLVGQFDNSSPYTSGYQLFPRMLTDIMTSTVVTPTFSDVVSISSFTGLDADGVADSLGTMKWVKGIVTSIDFDGNGGYSFYITDGTDAINIYNFADVSGYTSPMMGDSIYAHGEVDQYNGLTELKVDSIYYIAGSYPLPTPTVVSNVSESTESELIQLVGFSLATPSQWPASGSANVDITNGTDTITMRIDSDTDIDGSPAPTGMFDVTGIGSQFDNSSPYTEGYQIFPRMLTDIYEYPTIPVYQINQVTGVDAAGMPDSNNVMCKLEGIVMGVDMQGSATAVSFTIHDGVDGISTYGSISNYTVNEGDEVRIIGSIGQYNGLLQMYLDSVVLISTGNALPTSPTVVTSLGENTESELITFENATMVDPTQWGSGSSGYTVDITNGTDTITMRIDADTDLYGTAAPVGAFNVTGIGGQFTFNAANFDGYQLLPRYLADIVPATPAASYTLAVSEIMANSNSSGINADWFELYNYGTAPIDLTGFSWDDESENPGTSNFPSVIIPAGGRVVVLDQPSSAKNTFETEWKLYANSITIIANDELTGSFPSFSSTGDGVFIYDTASMEITSSVYTTALAGYAVEFDTTGAFVGDAADGVNGAYTSLTGDVGSPGNLTPNSNVGEASMVAGLYPNPSNGQFRVEFTNATAFEITVMSLTGEQLMRVNGNATSTTIDLDAAAGAYLVRVVTAAGTEDHMMVVR